MWTAWKPRYKGFFWRVLNRRRNCSSNVKGKKNKHHKSLKLSLSWFYRKVVQDLGQHFSYIYFNSKANVKKTDWNILLDSSKLILFHISVFCIDGKVNNFNKNSMCSLTLCAYALTSGYNRADVTVFVTYRIYMMTLFI